MGQKELADGAGISQTAISQIESGGHLASLETLVRIAATLDTTASHLLACAERGMVLVPNPPGPAPEFGERP